jgi:protein-S-isoprenylcysteine O-methyltransferase Ste14
MSDVERTLFFGLFFAMLAVRFYYAGKQWRRGETSWQRRAQSADREGRWGAPFRAVMFASLMLVIAGMAFDPPWLSWMYIRLPDGLRWAGAVTAALFLVMLVWVHHFLGREWSIDVIVLREHKLVTSGPYRWVRHPMYTALNGLFIGLVLLSANWLLGLYTLLTLAFMVRRVPLEEGMLLEQFGDEYRRYMARTRRWLPKL